MHANQRAADVNACICNDRLDEHGILEIGPRRHGERAARVQLRDGVDNLKAVRLSNIALNNKRAVEVLAALHGKFNAALLQNGINARKRGLCGLKARTLADARADHFTRRAADDKQLAGLQLRNVQQLRDGLLRLCGKFFINDLFTLPECLMNFGNLGQRGVEHDGQHDADGGLHQIVRDRRGGGKAFALSVMQHLNDACDKWKKQENIDFSIYGTPLESTTYKFAKCLQKRFGIIKGVTDKNYITNSYHVHVSEPIDAFTKLKFESEFQRLSPGGAISYVEVPNMQQNIPAVLQVMQYIYDNIMYAELNTKSDYCQCCGYDGEIKIVENADGKLIWQCPNCGNTDQDKMNVARRTCGYIGTQYWNQGRTQEIKDRVLHL